MGERHNEIERMLIAAGWVLERQGKHNIWRNGQHTFATHVGTKCCAREIRHARTVIRAAEIGRIRR